MANISTRAIRTFFVFFIAAALLWGVANKDQYFVSAEHGIGYVLGIVGGSMMLLMLTYSLRKRLSFMQGWGNIRYWFSAHKALGIAGPAIILFHSGFRLGSTNSSVALVSMLIVAISGIIGRYIYTHIHNELTCRKENIQSIQQDAIQEKREVIEYFHKNSTNYNNIGQLENEVLASPDTLISALVFSIRMKIKANKIYRMAYLEALNNIKQSRENSAEGSKSFRLRRRTIKHFFRKHAKSIHRAAELGVYEKLFSLWHVLHIPLFIMFLITAVVHIYAVHVY